MDVVKICEVVDGCEDCPKYGDDCDGDKMTEHTDYISRADAIEAVAQQWLFEASVGNPYVNDDDIGEYRKLAEELFEDVPSADAVPQLKQTDTLIIADALRYLAKDTERHLVDRTRADALRQQFLKYGASMCKGGDSE